MYSTKIDVLQNEKSWHIIWFASVLEIACGEIKFKKLKFYF